MAVDLTIDACESPRDQLNQLIVQDVARGCDHQIWRRKV